MFYKKKTNKFRYLFIFFIIFIVLYKIYKNVDFFANNKEIAMKKEDNTEKIVNTKLSNLPTWKLNDLYNDINDSNISRDLNNIKKRIDIFQSYKGKIRFLKPNEFYIAIVEYEDIEKLMSKLGTYSYLKYAENLSKDENVKFYQKINEEFTNLSSQLIFFTLEINNLTEQKLRYFYTDANVLKYKQFIEDIRVYKPYQLSEELEKILIEKSVTSSTAWSRLFDETIDNMIFEYNGQKYNQSQFLELMNGKDDKVRKETSKIFGKTIEKQGKLFAYITNILAKDKEISDRWRGFKTPISSRNLNNLIDDEVVEALREAVKNNYKNISHRYYKWKAKQFKREKLHYYDRNAPLPFDDDKFYEWKEAKKIVYDAYNEFSPEMASIGKEFFDKNWIDVPTRQGKMGGGFMCPTIPEVHPYILLNYQGKTRDVMTLAHELGHGIHQRLSDKNGLFNSRAPLTLAETASVFGEQLAFKKIMNIEKNKEQKKAILANKIEDKINTVIRQIAFLEFETKVHNERKIGEIPLERLNEIWLEVQYESLGRQNFIFDDEYKNYWMYIPHFIHSPFYVYSYAFGEILVDSLYSIYESNPNGFQEKYIELLKVGSTKRYDEALKIFNINPRDPKFWQNGLNVIIKMIDELEKM